MEDISMQERQNQALDAVCLLLADEFQVPAPLSPSVLNLRGPDQRSIRGSYWRWLGR